MKTYGEFLAEALGGADRKADFNLTTFGLNKQGGFDIGKHLHKNDDGSFTVVPSVSGNMADKDDEQTVLGNIEKAITDNTRFEMYNTDTGKAIHPGFNRNLLRELIKDGKVRVKSKSKFPR